MSDKSDNIAKYEEIKTINNGVFSQIFSAVCCSGAYAGIFIYTDDFEIGEANKGTEADGGQT